MARSRPRLDLESVFRLTQMADVVVPFCIRAVADLGIADLLAGGPRSVEDLAAATNCHAPSLHRVLRALAAREIFVETEPRTFALTRLSEPLRGDHPMSMRDACPLLPAYVEAWAEFAHCLRTGEPAFDRVHGQRIWDYFVAHPDEGARFDRSMAALTRLEVRATLGSYEWADLRHVVDVGGGNGAYVIGLLSRFPDLHATLFDLPHVVAAAPAWLREAGVGDRCTIVAGSFFDEIPRDADAYVLKRILYGWDADAAIRILERVRAAMRTDSRLLIVEPVADVDSDGAITRTADVLMLAFDGGRARTPAETERLLERAGFRSSRVIPASVTCLIEALPVERKASLPA